MPENLDEQQIERLWKHAIHEDNNFNNRMYFFLISESILIGSITSVLFNKYSSGKLALIFIICLSLIITGLWAYVQIRQKYIFSGVRTRLREVDPQLQAIMMRREQAKWPISNTSLLAYGIPILVALIWITLLVLTINT